MKRLFIILGIVFLFARTVGADTWAASVEGNWTDDARWLDGSAPTASDGVLFSTTGATYVASLNNVSTTVAALYVSSPDATLAVRSGGGLVTLSVTGGVDIGAGRLYTSGPVTFNAGGGITNHDGIFQSGGSAATTVLNGLNNDINGEVKLSGVRGTGGFIALGADLTVSGGFTNLGTVSMETNSALQGGSFARLHVSGALFNSGTIDSKLFAGTYDSDRTISPTSMNNTGTIINNNVSDLVFNGANGTYENSGTIRGANGGIQFVDMESINLAAGGVVTGPKFVFRGKSGNPTATSFVNVAVPLTSTGEILFSALTAVINDSTITAAGPLNLWSTQLPTSQLTNTSNGTINFGNGGLIDSFTNVSNAGTINVTGALILETGASWGNGHQFVNSGDVIVPPGSSFYLRQIDGTASFTMAPGASMGGGGSLLFAGVKGAVNEDWAPGTSPLDLASSTITGSGSLDITGGLTLRDTVLGIPLENAGTMTIKRNSTGNTTFHAALTNKATGIVNMDATLTGGVAVFIGDEDIHNQGEFNVIGSASLRPVNESTSTGEFVNEAGATVNFTANPAGFIPWTLPLNNKGDFNITGRMSSNRSGLTILNSGTITAAADWSMSGALSFENSGALTSTGGNFYSQFNRDLTGHFTNTATGVWTIANGAFIKDVKDVVNTGDIVVTGGAFNVEFGQVAGNAFMNTGNIDLAPGSSMSIYRNGNASDFYLEEDATLDGGGTVYLTRMNATVNQAWEIQDSPLFLAVTTLGGTGSLHTASALTVSDSTLAIPVTNTGTALFKRGTGGSVITKSFTNDIGGVTSIDSAVSGAITVTMGDQDMVNAGEFYLKGNTSTFLSLIAPATSTGKFINEASGIVTIEGTSSRKFAVPLDNRGTVQLKLNLTLGSGAGSNINSGRLEISPGVTATVYGASTTNEPAGVIAGTGRLTFSGAAFANNGKISPGFSVGTLYMTGTVNNGATAEFDAEIKSLAGPGTGNDFLSVTGSLAVNGIVRPKVTGFLPKVGDEFVIMQCTGTLSGSLQVVNDPGVYPDFGVVVDPPTKQVKLIVTDVSNLDYVGFQEIFFTDEQIANGEADAGYDFDGDGLVNFLEWIYGENPTSVARVTSDPKLETNLSGNLVFVYPESTRLPAITVELLASSDLSGGLPLNSADYTRTSAPMPGVPDVNLVSLEVTNAALNSSPRQFFQVQFSVVP